MSTTADTTTTGSLISSLSSAPTTTLSSTANSSSAASALTADSTEWLTLLTTQLQYQDPTQPSDSTQFVAELAQFSGVQQQVQTNTTLSSISQQLSAGSLGQAAALIGHTVEAPATSYIVPSSGSASTATYSYSVSNASLSNPELQVTNAAGSVVATVPVSPGSGSVSFGGTSGSGGALPAGSYTLSLVGTDTTGSTQTAGTLTASGTVTQVLQSSSSASTSGSGGGWELQLDNGSVISASSVTDLTS